MSRLAIITARGGSKRIPKKNIREFCGKPILAYSIEAALSSGLFDNVMVSTDDTEIAQIAEKYGAEVPFFRSEATSGDFATTNDVLAEVLAEYEKRGMHFDIACCIYPTAPFVTAQKLTSAVEQLEASDADTLIPVVSFYYPPQRAMVVEQGRLVFNYPAYLDIAGPAAPLSGCGSVLCIPDRTLCRESETDGGKYPAAHRVGTGGTGY